MGKTFAQLLAMLERVGEEARREGLAEQQAAEALLDSFLGQWVRITYRAPVGWPGREEVIGRVVVLTATMLVVRRIHGAEQPVMVDHILVIEPWTCEPPVAVDWDDDRRNNIPSKRSGDPGEAVPGGVWQTTHGVVTDVQSRLQMLAGWDAAKCYQAISEGGCQKTVQYALERRIRVCSNLARKGRGR